MPQYTLPGGQVLETDELGNPLGFVEPMAAPVSPELVIEPEPTAQPLPPQEPATVQDQTQLAPILPEPAPQQIPATPEPTEQVQVAPVDSGPFGNIANAAAQQGSVDEFAPDPVTARAAVELGQEFEPQADLGVFSNAANETIKFSEKLKLAESPTQEGAVVRQDMALDNERRKQKLTTDAMLVFREENQNAVDRLKAKSNDIDNEIDRQLRVVKEGRSNPLTSSAAGIVGSALGMLLGGLLGGKRGLGVAMQAVSRAIETGEQQKLQSEKRDAEYLNMLRLQKNDLFSSYQQQQVATAKKYQAAINTLDAKVASMKPNESQALLIGEFKAGLEAKRDAALLAQQNDQIARAYDAMKKESDIAKTQADTELTRAKTAETVNKLRPSGGGGGGVNNATQKQREWLLEGNLERIVPGFSKLPGPRQKQLRESLVWFTNNPAKVTTENFKQYAAFADTPAGAKESRDRIAAASLALYELEKLQHLLKGKDVSLSISRLSGAEQRKIKQATANATIALNKAAKLGAMDAGAQGLLSESIAGGAMQNARISGVHDVIEQARSSIETGVTSTLQSNGIDPGLYRRVKSMRVPAPKSLQDEAVEKATSDLTTAWDGAKGNKTLQNQTANNIATTLRTTKGGLLYVDPKTGERQEIKTNQDMIDAAEKAKVRLAEFGKQVGKDSPAYEKARSALNEKFNSVLWMAGRQIKF